MKHSLLNLCENWTSSSTMDTEKPDFSHCGEKSLSECFDEALRAFDGISNCNLATNSSEVQVRV